MDKDLLVYIKSQTTKDKKRNCAAPRCILLPALSTEVQVQYLAISAGKLDLLICARSVFEHGWLQLLQGEELADPKLAVQHLITAANSITDRAIGHTEGALKMGTEDMTIEQLAKEIADAKEQLPADHPLRAGKQKSIADRSQAITALVEVRNAVEESNTTTTTTTTTKENTEMKATTTTKKAKATTKKANSGKPGRVALFSADSRFALNGAALKAKDISELKMHGKSDRAAIMSHMIKNKARSRNSFALAALAGAVKPDTNYRVILNDFVKREFIKIIK